MCRTGCTGLRSLLPVKGVLLLVSLLHVVASVSGCWFALAPLVEQSTTDGVGPLLVGTHGSEALLPEQKTGSPLLDSDWRRLEWAGKRGNPEKLVVLACSLRQRVRLTSFHGATLHAPGRMPGMYGARSLFHRKSGGSEGEACLFVSV